FQSKTCFIIFFNKIVVVPFGIIYLPLEFLLKPSNIYPLCSFKDRIMLSISILLTLLWSESVTSLDLSSYVILLISPTSVVIHRFSSAKNILARDAVVISTEIIF